MRPDREELGLARQCALGDQAFQSAISLLSGREFAAGRASRQKALTDAIPCGTALAALNSVDPFKDVKRTKALMAGFLNAVGRRREALALLSTLVEEIASEPQPLAPPVKLADLVEAGGAPTTEHILVLNGFELFEDGSFLLHPNEPGGPVAVCKFKVCLFGHSRLRGIAELRNEKSAPVEFCITLEQGARLISNTSYIATASMPAVFEINFEPTAGLVQLRLSTRMASELGRNTYAWAAWRGLEFTAAYTERPSGMYGREIKHDSTLLTTRGEG
jgi:hypothetical protein